MNYHLVITSAAQQDIKDTALHYLDICPTLAEKFLDILEEAFNKLEENPQHYSFFGDSKNNQKYCFHKVFLLLAFKIGGDEVIVVGLYSAQDPDKILKRI